jgi:flagellar hook-basal body complex protein FliE
MDRAVFDSMTRSIEFGDVPGIGRQRNDAAEMQRSERLARQDGFAAPPSGANFMDLLQRSLEQVNHDQHVADHAIKEMIAGRTKNVHETMLAVEQAEISLKLMMQVRNKILDAYNEIMRMQV